MKRLSAQVNVILHAVGILLALPHVLLPTERIVSLSLGAASHRRKEHRPWDLETDQRIAEFTFINWTGQDAARKSKLFADLTRLAEADTTKSRFLYVTGATIPRQFLDSGTSIHSVLPKKALWDAFVARHGLRFSFVRDYWLAVRDRVEVVDLEPLLPGLGALAGVETEQADRPLF